jgi:hypothetical protein
MADDPAVVLDSPQGFALWWNHRAHRADRAIVAEAERRGLLRRSGGLIVLTQAGRALRAAARQAKGSV